jgi:hypothetical protein
MRTATVIAALLLSTVAFDVAGEEMISDFDRARLARLDEARAQAMDEAAEAAIAERAAIDSVMEPEAGPVSEQAVMGDWRCRIMKVGGYAPAKVYDWYHCRISEGENGSLLFEKLDGGQLINGVLDPYSETSLVFVGAMSVKGEPRNRYSGSTARAGAGALTSQTDQVGVFSMIGEDRARIELPFPAIESTFDIIELQR